MSCSFTNLGTIFYAIMSIDFFYFMVHLRSGHKYFDWLDLPCVFKKQVNLICTCYEFDTLGLEDVIFLMIDDVRYDFNMIYTLFTLKFSCIVILFKYYFGII